MRWRKRGLVWGPDGSQAWARSHAAVPTPVLKDDGGLRVYVTCLDDKGRGRPGWVDLDPDDPTRVIAASAEPLLDLGRPGAFDDNGVMATSVVARPDGSLALYYSGFELGVQVRYRIMVGLALSRDGGRSFRRVSEAPVLDRADGELCVRGGACVAPHGGGYRMWYVGGSEWTEIDGKPMPVYELRVADSADGLQWPRQGRLSLSVSQVDEYGFGRPWVCQWDGAYELHYSIRRRSLNAYRLGHARSADGLAWQRDDAGLGLDVSLGAFDQKAIMYSAVIRHRGQELCFYNGDEFGRAGFGLAVREA